MHCSIATSTRKYNSITEDYSCYQFTKKEIVLTSFPRHDTLLLGADKEEKIIHIIPTWRKNLMGKVIGDGSMRELNKNFEKTAYVKHWKSLLHSSELQKLQQIYKYKIIFFVHANIQPYIYVFHVPSNIEFLRHDTNSSIQTLFQRTFEAIDNLDKPFSLECKKC